MCKIFSIAVVSCLFSLFSAYSYSSAGTVTIRSEAASGIDAKRVVGDAYYYNCWAVDVKQGNPDYIRLKFTFQALSNWGENLIPVESIVFKINGDLGNFSLKPQKYVTREFKKTKNSKSTGFLDRAAANRGYAENGPFRSGLKSEKFRVAVDAVAYLSIKRIDFEPIFNVNGNYNFTVSVQVEYDNFKNSGSSGVYEEVSGRAQKSVEISSSVESYCPNGDYDGANCRYGKPTDWVNAFEWDGNMYAKSHPYSFCGNDGSWFDSANCLVGKPLKNTEAFEYNDRMYTTPQCPRVKNRHSSTVVFEPVNDEAEERLFVSSGGVLRCENRDAISLDLRGPNRDLNWYRSQIRYFVGARKVENRGKYGNVRGVGEWFGKRFRPAVDEPDFIKDGMVNMGALFDGLGMELEPNSLYEIKTIDDSFHKPNRIFIKTSQNIASCSAENSSGDYSEKYKASNAFDDSDGSMWISEVWKTPATISYTFPEKKIVSGYSLRFSNGSLTSRAPKDFDLQGSNDGVNWETIDVRRGETGWSGVEVRSFQAFTSDAFRTFRLVFHDDNDDREGVVVISLSEIDFIFD